MTMKQILPIAFKRNLKTYLCLNQSFFKLIKMNKLSTLVIGVISAMTINAQNNVCFTIEVNPNSSDPALGVFSKYVNVFGCGIYAEGTVSDENVLHAAAIWAELLDNDEDGVVDDQDLLTELVTNEALMPIFLSDGNAAENTFFNNYSGNGVGAILWQSEMNPATPGYWGSDATIEEIMHTINSVGHVNIYPAAFSLSPNSSLLTAAMDTARGGQHLSIPTPYPNEAWYHYDDATCDYECMAIEYLYWMTVTNMGILNDSPTCSGIANEWEPCSPALLQSTDVLGYALITDPAYKLPQIAPDGNYCPSALSIETNSKSKLNIYPNPGKDQIQFELPNDETNIGNIEVFTSIGQLVLAEKFNSSEFIWNTEHLAKGTYIVKINTQNEFFTQQLIIE